MRLELFQRQILVNMLNLFHINFQRQILKGQLSINWGKKRSLAHNNFPVVLFFILQSNSSAILRIHFVCLPLFEYLYLLV